MSSGNKSFVLICTVISILALLIAGVNISRLFQIEKSSDINENSPQSEDVEEQFDVRNVSTTSIDISPKTIDFGVVKADTVLIAQFRVFNKGGEWLYVQNLHADCICTSVEKDKSRVPPKDSVVITVKLDTKGKSGDNTIYATFRANTKELEHKLRLKAMIKPFKTMLRISCF